MVRTSQGQITSNELHLLQLRLLLLLSLLLHFPVTQTKTIHPTTMNRLESGNLVCLTKTENKAIKTVAITA